LAEPLTRAPGFKKLLIVIHDLAMTALAVVLAISLRFEGEMFAERITAVLPVLPLYLGLAGVVYTFFHLYRGKWRFASMPDLVTIAKAVGLLCLAIVVIEAIAVRVLGMPYFLGRRLLILYWLMQCTLLGAPRLIYRYLKDRYSYSGDARKEAVFALLLGRGNEVEPVVRALESSREARVVPVAILSPRSGDLGQSIRGVPVDGTLDALEEAVVQARVSGTPIRRLIVTPSALERDPEELSRRATRLGLALSRFQHLGQPGAAIEDIEIEDLLSRPPVDIEPDRLAKAVHGKCVLVTGGGGSIGSELCRRAVSLGAAHLVIIENAEPALYAILDSLSTMRGQCRVTGHIADIRDPERLATLMRDLKPDVVFHAAALKQVPYLERDWDEGIKTNVFGSINVADAAIAAAVPIVVMISTDKAVKPVSVLGATKRFAERSMEARDAVHGGKPEGTRLISVRFGNVLGSSGSVIPLFRAQIARGGPVTVTDPEMVRYFMTIEEAADLVIVASGHATQDRQEDRVAVYVLRMGQPVRIMDLAERMIRLAGFEPRQDIPIRVVGARPGERINEQLFNDGESLRETGIEGVMAARTEKPGLDEISHIALGLRAAIATGNWPQAETLLRQAVPDFNPDDALPQQPATPDEPAEPAPSPKPATRRARKPKA
jgi:FlaA1/EpsC-like NDP-sugar epimerase